MAQANRRTDLDGLRGIAIILTILLHYVSRGGYFPIQYAPEPIANLLDSFWSGVDIFFVLSGFLIGGILIDNRKATNFFQVFYLRRALRILPLALLTILFAYIAMPMLGVGFPTDRQIPPQAYLLFINNFWTASGVNPYPPLGPMWSLAIEEQFYLMAPMFILLVSHRKWISALVFIILASPWIRILSPWFSAWDFTLYRLDGLAAGMLVAALLRDQRFINYALANQRRIDAYTLGIVIASFLFSMSSGFSPSAKIALGISLNSLATAAIIIYLSINRTTQLGEELSRPWLVTTGRWSYFLYLMHMPILFCVKIPHIPFLLQPAAALAICLVCASVSWKYIESPLISFGKRKEYQQVGRSLRFKSPT